MSIRAPDEILPYWADKNGSETLFNKVGWLMFNSSFNTCLMSKDDQWVSTEK